MSNEAENPASQCYEKANGTITRNAAVSDNFKQKIYLTAWKNTS